MTHHTKPCPECQGSGTQLYERVHRHSASNDSGFIEEYEDDCENCHGSGEIVDDEYEEELGDWLYHKLKDEEMDHG
jgi:DnaJ-class molecular chaperone